MPSIICNTPELIQEAVAWLTRCVLLAVDVETIPNRKRKDGKRFPYIMTVVSYSGISDNGHIYDFAFQLSRTKDAFSLEHPLAEQAILAIKVINECPIRKTLHNGTYDCAWFLRYCVPLTNYAYDSMTLWWSRYPDLPKTLDFVCSIVLDDHAYWKMGRKEEDFTSHTFYAMKDTNSTLRATIHLLGWLLNDSAMQRNFYRAHLRCLTGLGMSVKGMQTDEKMFNEMEEELTKAADEALEKLQYIVADSEFNPNSVPAKKDLFYGLLGATPRNAKGRVLKRVTGNAKPSVGSIVLRGFKSEHPILRRIVTRLQEAQEPAKQLSNVIGLQFSDTRFRTGYDGIGTTTTRLSSRKDAFNFGGNAQNIRKKYRRFLRAELAPKSFIIEGDFSAADDVYISYESGEQRKIEVIEAGLDTHSYNAANIYFPNWSYQRVVDGKAEFFDEEKTIKNPDYVLVTHPITGIRQITKKLTHGANYLMAGHTVLNTAGREAIVAAAIQLGHLDAGTWSIDELVAFCDWLDGRYRNYYPRFARAGSGSYYAELSLELRKHGSFETIFGYTQRFLADPMDDSTLRACAATSGQANTAGRINMAMMEFDHGIRQLRFRDGDAPDFDEPALPVNEHSHGMSMRLQTHDSLAFVGDAGHPNIEEGMERFFHVMRRPVVCKGRIVNMGTEIDVGIYWNHKAITVKSPADVMKWIRNTLQ